MATLVWRKVNCVDPLDPNRLSHRQVSLLVQTEPGPRNTKTHMSVPVGWKPEPRLLSAVRMVDAIAADTVIQNIHVIDPVFGNQLVQYITQMTSKVCDFNMSSDQKEINELFWQAVRAPEYTPGQARATLPYKPGEITMDGARSEFVVWVLSSCHEPATVLKLCQASYLDRYPVMEEVLADDVATYCICQVKGDDGGQMIQCANGELWCLKEWCKSSRHLLI